MNVKGNIKAISVKDNNKYALKVGDAWYNGFGSLKFSKGEEVSIDYETNEKGFHTIKSIESITLKKVDQAEERWNKKTEEILKKESVNPAFFGMVANQTAQFAIAMGLLPSNTRKFNDLFDILWAFWNGKRKEKEIF